MFPYPMSRSEPSADDPRPLPASDLTRVLDQHVATGLPPDLALDLVLNELVLRAADATRASAGALALVRGDELVCRASTGLHAPDLGIPLNIRDGLSGACVRTRVPQICGDTESDARVDAVISRRLGVRSMLVVPVFDEETTEGSEPELAGVLEVFSPLAYAFSELSQTLLEEFARECTRIRHAAQLHDHQSAADVILPGFELIGAGAPGDATPGAAPRARQPYEAWTVILAALVILAAVGVSFLIGSRVGWLSSPQAGAGGPPVSVDTATPAAPANLDAASHGTDSARVKTKNKAVAKSGSDAAPNSSDELVVYDKGKVIFRLKQPRDKSSAGSAPEPVPAQDATSAPDTSPDRAAAETPSPVIAAASNTRIPAPRALWLAPDEAEDRLLSRVEPQYPADALAAHRSGKVVLEVHVAEDGTVSSVRTLSGDPVLAAAASQAVRTWHYQPYSVQGHPTEFRTDVILKFALPE